MFQAAPIMKATPTQRPGVTLNRQKYYRGSIQGHWAFLSMPFWDGSQTKEVYGDWLSFCSAFHGPMKLNRCISVPGAGNSGLFKRVHSADHFMVHVGLSNIKHLLDDLVQGQCMQLPKLFNFGQNHVERMHAWEAVPKGTKRFVQTINSNICLDT